MPINTGLADVSNGVLMAAVAIYAVAMLAYACDFAFGKKPARPRPDAGAGRRQECPGQRRCPGQRGRRDGERRGRQDRPARPPPAAQRVLTRPEAAQVWATGRIMDRSGAG